MRVGSAEFVQRACIARKYYSSHRSTVGKTVENALELRSLPTTTSRGMEYARAIGVLGVREVYLPPVEEQSQGRQPVDRDEAEHAAWQVRSFGNHFAPE